MSKKVVIVGGGFGGLSAARALKHADVDILLIDRTNHYLFQPLLYQVATSSLSPSDIAAPLREVLRHQPNARIIMGEVTRVDTARRKVYLQGEEHAYDYLIVATGVQNSYFGHDEWEKFAPGMKTIADALSVRDRILLAFEKAERATEEAARRRLMTFVVVGAGPTGVETAGAIAELAKQHMRRDFRCIDTRKTRVILIEALDRVLLGFEPRMSAKAKQALEDIGVEVRLQTKITNMDEQGVWIGDELVPTATTIWAAGTKAVSLMKSLDGQTDRAGRILVERDCSLSGHPEVFVVGDVAIFMQGGKPLPALAPVAVQQGEYVAGIIKAGLTPEKRRPFRYHDKGFISVLGRGRAVLQAGRLRLTGYLAWLAWVVVHILVLVVFRNRYKVLVEWVWSYLANRSGVRLITGQHYSEWL